MTGSGDDAESASGASIRVDAEVTDIESPDEESGKPGQLSTVSIDYSCIGGELEEDEVNSEYRYALSDSSLFLWINGKCSAMQFSGSSSTIIGKWTSSDLSVSIPSAYRPAGCEGAIPQDSHFETYLENATATYDISSTEMKGAFTGTFCYMPVLVEILEDNPNVTVVSSDCSTMKLKNKNLERTATFSIAYNNDKLTETLAYNGKTCKLTMPFQLSSDRPVCSEKASKEEREKLAAFLACAEESDFTKDLDSGILGKVNGGIPFAIQNALEHATPF